MDDYQRMPEKTVLVNCGLVYADSLIEALDSAIQDTGNLQLSQTLNDILDSYETIRGLLNR